MIAHIFADRCTRCNLCVAACPTHVIDPAAVAADVPVVARLSDCQTCYMCELYCPADAIYVAPDQHHAEAIDAEAVARSGQLGRLRRDYGWDTPDGAASPLEEFWRLGPLLREGGEIAARRHAARTGTARRPD